MRDESFMDPCEPPLTTEEERIRRSRVAELEATLDQIGAEAQARGLTEEILSEILNEELTAEEVALNRQPRSGIDGLGRRNREIAAQVGSEWKRIRRAIEVFTRTKTPSSSTP